VVGLSVDPIERIATIQSFLLNASTTSPAAVRAASFALPIASWASPFACWATPIWNHRVTSIRVVRPVSAISGHSAPSRRMGQMDPERKSAPPLLMPELVF